MVDLKINEETYVSEDHGAFKSIKGNLKLVGYGISDSVGISATTWSARGCNGGVCSFDENWLSCRDISNGLYVQKAGIYVLFWRSRLPNSKTSVGVGPRINDVRNDSALFTWARSNPRHTISGMELVSLSVDDLISTKLYSEDAITAYPISVWIFVIDDGA